MRTTQLDCKCGIYATEYTVRDYGRKIVVTAPYIKWEGNSGCLDFGKKKVVDAYKKAVIRTMCKTGELFCGEECITMDDVLFG